MTTALLWKNLWIHVKDMFLLTLLWTKSSAPFLQKNPQTNKINKTNKKPLETFLKKKKKVGSHPDLHPYSLNCQIFGTFPPSDCFSVDWWFWHGPVTTSSADSRPLKDRFLVSTATATRHTKESRGMQLTSPKCWWKCKLDHPAFSYCPLLILLISATYYNRNKCY